MTIIAVRPEDRVQAAPAPRNRSVRPAYLSDEVLTRAAVSAESRLRERAKRMCE